MSAELLPGVALVTGAGRGIGAAISLRLGRAGCRVALVARSVGELQAVAAAIGDAAPTLIAPADVTDDAQLASAVEQARGAFGPIGILINAAGAAPPRQPLERAAGADWDRVLATCLRAPIVLTRMLLPDMLAQRAGAVINIASIAAHAPRAGEAVYAAAKAGLVAFGQALFAEVRDSGIKVTTICPGYVDTAFIPPNRRVDRSKFLRPQDVADTVLHVLGSPPSVCPTEILLQPQFDPERR